MSEFARTYWKLVAVQLAAGLAVFLVATLLSPRLLLLETGSAYELLPFGYLLLLAYVVFVHVATRIALGRVGGVVRSPSASPSFAATEVARLGNLPLVLASSDFVATMIGAAFLITAVGADIDPVTKATVVLLVSALMAAAALATFVLLRKLVGSLLERLPPVFVREATELSAMKEVRALHVGGRIVLSVGVSVGFIAAALLLLVLSHGRTADAQGREAMASELARAVLAPVEGNETGSLAASEEAGALGFTTKVSARPLREPEITRNLSGVCKVAYPIEGGSVVVTFSANPSGAIASVYVGLGLIAAFFGAFLGYLLGRAYERDLDIAIWEVKGMGVFGGRMRQRASPRFAPAFELLEAVDGLGDVFQQFAFAQRRAIQGKAQTERMRALFLASMSHDLKAPLNAILGFAELLRRDDLTPGQRENVDIIVSRGRELLQLVLTVLDSARIEAGALQLARREVDMEMCLRRALAEARELSEEFGVTIRGELPDDLPVIIADELRLVQAFVCILHSSVRFTTKGGAVTLRAETPGPGDDYLRIAIETKAGAVSREELERIFVAYLYADEARKYGSLGLGLSLARSLIVLHLGRIEVNTVDGRVVFRVDIPRTFHGPMSESSLEVAL
ncbi:MAG: HAMP domain-containing sensor histidine kinase [Polyangiaceae bacterium]